MISIIVTVGILIFIEYYSIGIFLAAKKMGYEHPYRNFIPFYAFCTARRMSGQFTILTIPVNKMARMMIFVSTVTILAVIYAEWGSYNLPEASSESLWQIMLLVIGVCAFVFYLAIIMSSVKIFRRFNAKREYLCTLFAVPLVTIPFLYGRAAKSSPRSDAEMY